MSQLQQHLAHPLPGFAGIWQWTFNPKPSCRGRVYAYINLRAANKKEESKQGKPAGQTCAWGVRLPYLQKQEAPFCRGHFHALAPCGVLTATSGVFLPQPGVEQLHGAALSPWAPTQDADEGVGQEVAVLVGRVALVHGAAADLGVSKHDGVSSHLAARVGRRRFKEDRQREDVLNSISN